MSTDKLQPAHILQEWWAASLDQRQLTLWQVFLFFVFATETLHVSGVIIPSWPWRGSLFCPQFPQCPLFLALEIVAVLLHLLPPDSLPNSC